MSSTKIPAIAGLLLCFTSFNSCKKTVEPDLTGHQFFSKQYAQTGSQNAFYVGPTSDNGFVIFGTIDSIGGSTDDPLNLMVTKTDQYGNKLWSREYDAPYFWWAQVTKTKDGGFLLGSQYSGVLFKFDSRAEHVFTSSYYPYQGRTNWIPYESQSGKLYHSGTNGMSSGSPSITKMYILDHDGVPEAEWQFEDAEFGGKIQQFAVWKVDETTNSSWFCGSLFPKTPWNWNDPRKFFVSKFTNGNLEKIVFPDTGQISTSSYLATYIVTPDGGLIAITGIATISVGDFKSEYMRIMKFDKDLNLIWEKNHRLGLSYAFAASISLCRDGSYILSGNVNATGSVSGKGFLFKMTANGEKLWDRIFQMKGENSAYHAEEYKDGGYLITGSTLSYGNGNQGLDVVFMKTDDRGEVK